MANRSSSEPDYSACGEWRSHLQLPLTENGALDYPWMNVSPENGPSRTLPVLFFEDFAYFFWAIQAQQFRGMALAQALAISRLAQHIRPPRFSADNFHFDIRLGTRQKFKALKIAPKRRMQTKSAGIVRLRHLNMVALLKLVRTKIDAIEISQAVRRVLMPCLAGTLANDQRCERFFSDRNNFDHQCAEPHRINHDRG